MPSGVEVEEVRAEATAPKTETVAESPESPEQEKVVKEEEVIEDKETSKEAEGETKPMEEEGVEVVLEEQGATKVVDDKSKARPTPDQNVFRHPQAVRPRAMRAPGGQPPPSYPYGSGSWGYGPPPPGYGPPPPHHHDYPPRPYPVPPYGSSGSFEEQGSYYHPSAHYSPHVQYPPPAGRYSDEVNVISPHHKTDPHYRPNLTPRPRHMQPPSSSYYQYPPTSPVSRPGGPPPTGPPRVRDNAMSRSEGPYSKAQRGSEHPEDGTWNTYGPPGRSPSADMNRRQPPIVTESSFDSEHQSRRSHPPTPLKSSMPPPAPTSSGDRFYGAASSWGSFESSPHPPPHPHYDHQYYSHPPASPYGSYMYSPGGLYGADSFPPAASYGPSGSFSYSYDDEERLLRDYHPDRDGDDNLKQVTPPGKKSRSKSGTPVASNTSANNMLLPKAAEEIDFDVVDPPAEPQTQPGDKPICESLADVNTYDVLCGRGGGTNSQVGNRRFRTLVQDFQPTYLLARRKEKPLLARTIVLIIRKRGGRFLKKDEDTGELFEVGDIKAEAKTSQALREGLDVRATKSAASSLLEKKKRVKQLAGGKGENNDDDLDDVSPTPSSKTRKASEQSPSEDSSHHRRNHHHHHHHRTHPGSPPTLPRLHGDEVKSGGHLQTPPLPQDQVNYRKRRRMRGGGFTADRFFPDFCPPRADLNRPASPPMGDHYEHGMHPHYPHTHHPYHHMSTTPIRRNNSSREEELQRYEQQEEQIASSTAAQGCASIAVDMVTGAATGSFCLGPTGWRR